MQSKLLPRLAWGTLIFNLAVIVWGAYVRASGSGAGCGRHWPLCNGEIIPHTGLTTTLIEFTHRLTSGTCLLLAFVVAAVGMRHSARGTTVRRASLAVLGFTLSEAIIGAGLVLLRYVDKDQSIGRAVSICLHLSNTFLLLGSLAITAWCSSFAPNYRLEAKPMRPTHLWRMAIGSLIATGVLGITGAMTALGDTLFHSTTLLGGMAQDFSSESHFLVKLRVIHPLVALLTGVLLFHFAELASDHRQDPRTAQLTTLQKGLVATQLILGLTNLVLLAPTGLQLAHLFVAESLWVVLVLTVVVSLQARQDTPYVKL